MTTQLLNIDNMDYMKNCADNSFDWVLADPPYFDGPNKLGFYGGRCSKTGVERGGYEKLGEWKVPGQEFFDEVMRVSKNQIIWGINYFRIQNLGTGRIVWDKCNEATTFSDCEIAYCSSIEHVRKFVYMWSGMMHGKSVGEGHIMQGNKKLNEKRIHPTQKPRNLYKHLFQNYITKGQRILDTHLGSGSSAIESHYYGCDFVGCEIDEKYLIPAQNRFNKETAQITMF